MNSLIRALAVVGLLAAPAAAEGRDGYAYLSGNGSSITMSGDSRDVPRIRSLKQGNAPVLWFRDGGREYVVRDPDTLAQLDAIWKPSRKLDDAEAALDRKEEEIDRKRDQLDARRDQLESRREALADRAADLDHDDKQRRELQQQQQALGDEIRGLDAPMKDLRAQTAALRRQIDALRQEQKAASAKEQVELRALFRRAITAGTAKPAP